MKNKFLKYTLGIVITAFTIVSCDDDQNLDQSTLVPTNPTVSVALSFDNTTTLVEQNADYNFTVSLSEPQVVDVKVYLSQTGGDATLGEDYDMPDSVIIPANANSVTGVISILEDDTIEDLETVIITIGAGVRTANANVNATTVTFNIANLTTGDLLANLSWAASEFTTDNSGTEIEATDLADMRLLVTDVPYSTIIKEEDGAAFETITLDATTPDGEYYIVADFFAASEIPADLDLTISFDQVGVINGESYTFPAALNNAGICSLNNFILAKVTKTGNNYTIEEIGEKGYDLLPYISYPVGEDVTDTSGRGPYSSNITVKEICGGFNIKGINASWMLNFWTEEIQPDTEADVFAMLNEDGSFVIESQFIFTTTFNGTPYDYTIKGEGTFDPILGVLHLEYYLDQDGLDVGEYSFEEGLMSTPYFVADVSIN